MNDSHWPDGQFENSDGEGTEKASPVVEMKLAQPYYSAYYEQAE